MKYMNRKLVSDQILMILEKSSAIYIPIKVAQEVIKARMMNQ